MIMDHRTQEALASAATALEREGRISGYTIQANGEMVTVFTPLGIPFYNVKIIVSNSNGKNRIRYDVGREVVSNANRAMLRVRARRTIN